MSDLGNMVAGDYLLVTDAWRGWARYFKRRVVRTTKTQVIDDRGIKWRRDNGREVGRQYPMMSAKPFLPEHHTGCVQQTRDEDERRLLCSQLGGFEWRSLPLDVLREVRAMLPKAAGPKDGE